VNALAKRRDDVRGLVSNGNTLRDLGDLAPDLEQLLHDIDPLLDASEDGVPAAERVFEGAEPVLEAAHVFLPEVNPILAYLQFNRTTVASFLVAGAASIGENLAGGYTRPRTAGTLEHLLPQSSFFEIGSFIHAVALGPRERLRGAQRQLASHRTRFDRELRMQALGG
jgi:hypothetical protein